MSRTDLYDSWIEKLETQRDTSLKHGCQYIESIHQLLQNDMATHLNELEACRSDPSRNEDLFHYHIRAYCRSVFSMIEGSLAAIQASLISAHERQEIELSYQEASVLREENYTLKENGVIEPRLAKLPPVDKLRFVTALYARSCRIRFELETEGLGWRSLLAAAEIRNRLMHPRDHEEYGVTGAEAVLFNNAGLWFIVTIGELILGTQGKDAEREQLGSLRNSYQASELLNKKSQRSDVLRLFNVPTSALAFLVYQKLSTLFHQERIVSFETSIERCNAYQADPSLRNLQETQRIARSLFLSFFAEVNGICSLLNKMALWSHERGDAMLDEGELALVREKRYYFRRNKVKAAANFNNVKTTVELVFHLFPKNLGSTFTLDKGSTGWEAFDAALALRNRIAHPTDPRDVLIEPRELKCLTEAFTWFSEQIIALNRIIEEWMKRQTNEART